MKHNIFIWLLGLAFGCGMGCGSSIPPAVSEDSAAAQVAKTETPAPTESDLQVATPAETTAPTAETLGTLPEGVGLAVGQTVTDFTAVNTSNEPVALSDLVAQGPILLVFYRGGW